MPVEELNASLECYVKANQLIWCQEEPKNQGGWDFIKPRLRAVLEKKWNLNYVGRISSSAPAVGSAKLHAIQQAELVECAIFYKGHSVDTKKKAKK